MAMVDGPCGAGPMQYPCGNGPFEDMRNGVMGFYIG